MTKGNYVGQATMRGGEIVAWRDVDTTRVEIRAKITRDQARRDNGMTACSREIDDDEVGAIATLADLNRANRAKFAARSVRDYDRHRPIRTLRDINIRNHACYKRRKA